VNKHKYTLRTPTPCQHCKTNLPTGTPIEISDSQIICLTCWKKL
jgi:hypothetical protein